MNENTRYKNWKKVKAELLANTGVQNEYEKLTPYYQIVSAVMGLRIRKKLTQKELAKLAGITQAEVARLESFNHSPNIKTLNKIAEATGTKLKIALVD